MSCRLISCFIFLIFIFTNDAKSFGSGFRSYKSSSSSWKSSYSRNSKASYGWNIGSSSNTYVRNNVPRYHASFQRVTPDTGGRFGHHGSTYKSPQSSIGFNHLERNRQGVSYQYSTSYNPPVARNTVYGGNSYSSKGPGIGQIAKEAFVYGVTTAAVNRMIPGGIYGTWGSPWEASSDRSSYRSNSQTFDYHPPTDTSLESTGFTSENGRKISLKMFQQLTEDLLRKDVNNARRFMKINLQGQKIDDSNDDIAFEHLLTVQNETWSIPTIKFVLDLYNNYNINVHVQEVITNDTKLREDAFLDLILKTKVMKAAMEFLVNGGYVKNDETEFKKKLRDIWFTHFARTQDGAGSSGFESVFLAEKFDSEIIGLHNWIYYAKMETNGRLNYLGYIRNVMLDGKGAVIKVRSSLNGTIQPITSIFVGTSPELEIALYTLCFYTLPNYPCPVKLGGKDIVVTVNTQSIDNKNIIISAYADLWVKPLVHVVTTHQEFKSNSTYLQIPFTIFGLKMYLWVLVLLFNPVNKLM